MGAPAFIGHNRWTREQVKHGTQREREAVFNALHHGWGRDTVGSHIIRAATTSTTVSRPASPHHLGAIFSTISGNHIHHIHTTRRFGGHEMAGIKLHAGIDVRIADNHIHHTVRGIWLDWQAQGARVQRNLLHSNATEDFYTEVCHGPTIVDHNLLLSPGAVKNCSQGTAFVHNLIAGSVTMQPIPIRYTPYHLPHSTQVMGLMTILGGDDRWLHNVFIDPIDSQDQVMVEDENADLASADGNDPRCVLGAYAEWPAPTDEWAQRRRAGLRRGAVAGDHRQHLLRRPPTAHPRDHCHNHRGSTNPRVVDCRWAHQQRLRRALSRYHRCPPGDRRRLGSAFQPRMPV